MSQIAVKSIARQFAWAILLVIFGQQLRADQQPDGNSGNSAPADPITAPLTINLQDALLGARKYGTQIQSAAIAVLLAKQDKLQARAATLPNLSALNQFIYTQGNGTPSGVFVANDGVHVYNEQAVVHEELLSLIRRGEIKLATAAEAFAKAKADVTARGLNLTVIQNYYAIASGQRRLANGQSSLREAQHFLDTTQKQEMAGEVAHADVIKAQLQVQQRQRDIQDAELSVQKAKTNLAVLIFPALRIDYSVIDDLSNMEALPALPLALREAGSKNSDVRAAKANVSQARIGISVARYAYLPSFSIDFWYGIDANQLAARTDYPTQASGRSTLPNYLVPFRQNLGYSAAATLTVPLWNWGSTHSKVKQASLREQQARLDLTLTQKQLQADVAAAYREAETASSQVESLRSSSELSDESLRLAILRYQAGEATALEVVDAETTANQGRNAYDDGLLRYRLALANLQALTGTF